MIDRIDLLRDAVRLCKGQKPFHLCPAGILMPGWVLPEHMHTIWTLPEGDDDFSSRWKLIETHFSKSIPLEERRSNVRVKRGECGIWQR